VVGLVHRLGEYLRALGAVLGVGFVSVRRNFGLALLSLALAFGIWIFITDTTGSTKTGWFVGDIPVQAVSVPEGLTLAAPLPDVTVRIEAPENVFDNLAVEDFRATINLAGAAVGQLDVDVRVQVLSERGVKVVQVEPAALSIELKPVVSQLVPVVADVVGSPPIGYEAQQPVLSPEQVLVSGPEDLVGRVKSAVATVNLSGAVGGVRQSYSLVARDDRGFIVAGVSLEPSSASVEIVVEQKQFERLVAVSPSLRGSPAAGYNVTAEEVDPPTVTLLGPIEILNVTSIVLTDDIDISGASSDVFRSVALQLPTEVSVSGNATVSVRVRISAGQGEATFGVAPTVSGLGSDLRVVSVTPSVDVILQGELPLLRGVIPDQVKVTVDLTGLAAGTHLLEPHVEAPQNLQVLSTSPSKVEVVLESTLEPTPTPTLTPTPTPAG
jgi:YbbR domain-containing protein